MQLPQRPHLLDRVAAGALRTTVGRRTVAGRGRGAVRARSFGVPAGWRRWAHLLPPTLDTTLLATGACGCHYFLVSDSEKRVRCHLGHHRPQRPSATR